MCSCCVWQTEAHGSWVDIRDTMSVCLASAWLFFFFFQTTFFCLSRNGYLFLSLLMTFPFEQIGLFQAVCECSGETHFWNTYIFRGCFVLKTLMAVTLSLASDVSSSHFRLSSFLSLLHLGSENIVVWWFVQTTELRLLFSHTAISPNKSFPYSIPPWGHWAYKLCLGPSSPTSPELCDYGWSLNSFLPQFPPQ